MKLSVVIPTRNESANIARAVRAFSDLLARGEGEVVVVDNFSADETRALARAAGARVFEQGPERCAQRNRGWREARGDWILFADADMEFPAATQREILSLVGAGAVDALYVRETRVGRGFRTKVRNYERSFYDGTCIDGLRVVRRSLLERVGGYDEGLVACEDWDLDHRLRAAGARTAITRGAFRHHEEALSFGRLMAKKKYYAGTMDAYRRKWPGDRTVARQFSPWYRLVGVFLEQGKWRRVLSHPLLFAGVVFERCAVGAVYLLNCGRASAWFAGFGATLLAWDR
ncbi:MAG: glycosyltransferase family 2 protein, partial [Kiritimatiellia bacterium]